MNADSVHSVLRSSKTVEKTGMSEKEVFSTVLFHCLIIIVSPILTFFVFSFWIFPAIALDSMASNIYSAFAAVVVLHIALANLIYQAYFNTETVPGFDKLDKED